MRALFNAVSRAFVREGLAALIALAPGILAAPNLDGTIALGVAALIAAISAGVKVLQEFVPLLTFASLLPQPIAAWADAFSRAFLAAFLVAVAAWLAMPDLSGWRAAGFGAVVGALAAGIRALEGALTPGERPFPNVGAGKRPEPQANP